MEPFRTISRMVQLAQRQDDIDTLYFVSLLGAFGIAGLAQVYTWLDPGSVEMTTRWWTWRAVSLLPLVGVGAIIAYQVRLNALIRAAGERRRQRRLDAAAARHEQARAAIHAAALIIQCGADADRERLEAIARGEDPDAPTPLTDEERRALLAEGKANAAAGGPGLAPDLPHRAQTEARLNGGPVQRTRSPIATPLWPTEHGVYVPVNPAENPLTYEQAVELVNHELGRVARDESLHAAILEGRAVPVLHPVGWVVGTEGEGQVLEVQLHADLAQGHEIAIGPVTSGAPYRTHWVVGRSGRKFMLDPVMPAEPAVGAPVFIVRGWDLQLGRAERHDT